MDVYYIVYAVPAFFLLIGIEYAFGRWRGRNTYRLADSLASIGAGVLSVLTGIVTRGLLVVIYAAAFTQLAPATLPSDHWLVWLLAILGYDLCYYWFHRLSHERALLWAAHVVHHQSEDFNLGTALRQSSTTFIFGWIFYMPLALVGIPPDVFAAAAGINLLYQYWVHTEHVPKLGWLDRVFVTASNHRVHHGRNDAYLDRNYAGIFILWDRIFGTFAEERDEEPVRFGIRKPYLSFNAVRANLEPYLELWRDARATRVPADRWRGLLAPTGWRPRDLPAVATPPLDVPKFEVARSPWLDRYGLAQFVLITIGTVAMMIWASSLDLASTLAGIGLLTLGLWSVGELMGRGERALGLEAARLAVTTLAAAVLLALAKLPLVAGIVVLLLAAVSLAWLKTAAGREEPVVS